jgi:hypothetical protein
LNIQITTRCLMEDIEFDGIHHIDGTYRITTNGFPLIVYGISDQCGQFHPICLMLTSHEKYSDFHLFYKGLVDLASKFNLEYDPDYIMQDACPASKKAILEFFKDIIILMCYFHVKKNVRNV